MHIIQVYKHKMIVCTARHDIKTLLLQTFAESLCVFDGLDLILNEIFTHSLFESLKIPATPTPLQGSAAAIAPTTSYSILLLTTTPRGAPGVLFVGGKPK